MDPLLYGILAKHPVNENDVFKTTVDMSGFFAKDIKVQLERESRLLTLQAKRQAPGMMKSLEKSLTLPANVNLDSVELEMTRNGHVTITGLRCNDKHEPEGKKNQEEATQSQSGAAPCDKVQAEATEEQAAATPTDQVQAEATQEQAAAASSNQVRAEAIQEQAAAAFRGEVQAEATQRCTQHEDMETETDLSPRDDGAATDGAQVENVEAMEAEAQANDDAPDRTSKQGGINGDEHSINGESTINKEFPGKKGDNQGDQGKDHFRIQLDVSDFSPDEISVEVTTNGRLKVRAEHVENTGSNDRKKISMTKEFFIDEARYDLDSIRSSLNKKGVLTVEAKMKDTLNPGLSVPVKVQVE